MLVNQILISQQLIDKISQQSRKQNDLIDIMADIGERILGKN
jgi:hypothetical protein